MKEPNKFHSYETEKITLKASDAAEYIKLFGSFTPTHLMLFSERPSSADIYVVVHDDLG